MSQDLLKEIQHLEELFTIETPKLKQITSHFITELEKGKPSLQHGRVDIWLTRGEGLTQEGGSIVCRHSSRAARRAEGARLI
jgi:hexokinase